jgi:hypothetical protein
MDILDGECRQEFAERDGRPSMYAIWPVYTPLRFDGAEWLSVAGPRHFAWDACMLVAASVWKVQPGLALEYLRKQVEAAVKNLDDGEQSVEICDAAHRVERTVLVVDVKLGAGLAGGTAQGALNEFDRAGGGGRCLANPLRHQAA